MDVTTPPLQPNAVELILDRHAVRRTAGLPTGSVLVGPVGAASGAFRAWATAHGHPVIAGPAAGVFAVATLVARCLDRARDLCADACAFLASHTGTPAAELRAALAGMTRHDLDRFFAAHDARLPPGAATRLARRTLEAAVSGSPPSSERWVADGASDPLAVLGGLSGLIPAGGLPAVVLTPPASAGIQEWFRAAGAAAVAVATRVPALPLGIAVPAEVWARYLAEGPDSRTKAVLREGAIELPVLDRTGVERVLRARGIEPPVIPPAVLPVVAGGVPDAFAAALATAAAVAPRAASEEDDDRARSAAERFLYQFLELLPDTAGRFELNADAGFRFGPRAAEVDLLARDLRIAVEIDGYYHFRDEANYRRDRAKDWELQRRGFLVLRFLADDIIPRLEEVRDRILAAVALRTAGVPA